MLGVLASPANSWETSKSTNSFARQPNEGFLAIKSKEIDFLLCPDLNLAHTYSRDYICSTMVEIAAIFLFDFDQGFCFEIS